MKIQNHFDIDDTHGCIDGLTVEIENIGECVVTTILVVDEQSSVALGKPIGKYTSIETEALKSDDDELLEDISEVIAQKLEKVYELDKIENILVIGLGNSFVEPDSIGPKVVEKLIITKHLKDTPCELPEEISQIKSLAAFVPGVLGTTGIESAKIVKGVVREIKPDIIIAVDSLSSSKFSRVNTVIQISDTGINPGSGIGNVREGINLETMGVPVIAIGVPTIISANVFANEVSELVLDAKPGCALNMDEIRIEQAIREVLGSNDESVYLSTKDVQKVVQRASSIIAGAINIIVGLW